jgi:hypothetical protein
VENTQKIIDWSIKYSEQLHLKAEYYTSIKKVMPDHFDIGVSIVVNDKKYAGRGTDKIEEIAYLKALSESIERSLLPIFNIENSNGLAVHHSLDQAKLNARNELIERDAFFCRYLLKSGMKKIQFEITEAEKYFKNENIDISYYEMCHYQDGYGVLCVADGVSHKRPFGLVMGTSFRSEVEVAKNQAFNEALRTVLSTVAKKESESISIEEFSKMNDDQINFRDHGRLSLNLEYSKYFKDLLNNEIIALKDNIDHDDFSYEVLDNALIPIPELPLLAVRANHPKLQQLYTGVTLAEKVNLNRLKQIFEEVNFKSINLIPHPFD